MKDKNSFVSNIIMQIKDLILFKLIINIIQVNNGGHRLL